MQAECAEAGVPATPGEVCAECMLAQRVLLTYGGVTPASALLGVPPREFHEYEDTTVDARRVDSPDEDVHERAV